MKKKLKLKKQAKFGLFLLILLIGLSYYGITVYNEYQYKETYEYKFIEKGYSKNEFEILTNHFDNNKLDEFLGYEKKEELIFNIINTKYYIKDNYDLYYEYIKDNEVTTEEAILKINTKTNIPYYINILPSDINKTSSVLVNKYYGLDKDYIPDNLVTISTQHSWGDYGSQKLIDYAYDAFKSWHTAALTEGIHLMINSSYRAYTDQERIYNNYRDTRGEKYADTIAARPGHSEHQTGLAIDMVTLANPNQAEFSESADYEWIINNAHLYGFILRYPEDKTSVTGYSYESWHYRYVGEEIATYIYNNKITFDEYYAFYLD